MPAGPMTDTTRSRFSRSVAWKQVLEQAQLVLAADERRLERLRAVAPATLRHDPQGAPRGDRRLPCP